MIIWMYVMMNNKFIHVSHDLIVDILKSVYDVSFFSIESIKSENDEIGVL